MLSASWCFKRYRNNDAGFDQNTTAQLGFVARQRSRRFLEHSCICLFLFGNGYGAVMLCCAVKDILESDHEWNE